MPVFIEQRIGFVYHIISGLCKILLFVPVIKLSRALSIINPFDRLYGRIYSQNSSKLQSLLYTFSCHALKARSISEISCPADMVSKSNWRGQVAQLRIPGRKSVPEAVDFSSSIRVHGIIVFLGQRTIFTIKGAHKFNISLFWEKDPYIFVIRNLAALSFKISSL